MIFHDIVKYDINGIGPESYLRNADLRFINKSGTKRADGAYSKRGYEA